MLAQKQRIVHLSIFLLTNFQFFSPLDSVRNLLLIGMHTTPTMSLDNLVKRKYLKYLKTNKNWFKPSNRRTYNQRLYVGFRIFLFFSFSAISLKRVKTEEKLSGGLTGSHQRSFEQYHYHRPPRPPLPQDSGVRNPPNFNRYYLRNGQI